VHGGVCGRSQDIDGERSQPVNSAAHLGENDQLDVFA
jgi:hypothetical protein